MGLRAAFAGLNNTALDRLEAEVKKLMVMDTIAPMDSLKSTFSVGFSPSLTGANAPSLLFRFGLSFFDKAKWDLREIGITQSMQSSPMLNEDERKMRGDYCRLKYEAMLLSIDQQRAHPSRSKMEAYAEARRIVTALDEIYDVRAGLARIQDNTPYTGSLAHCFDVNRFGKRQSHTLGDLFKNIFKREPQ